MINNIKQQSTNQLTSMIKSKQEISHRSKIKQSIKQLDQHPRAGASNQKNTHT